jgi:hypothetical protein
MAKLFYTSATDMRYGTNRPELRPDRVGRQDACHVAALLARDGATVAEQREEKAKKAKMKSRSGRPVFM